MVPKIIVVEDVSMFKIHIFFPKALKICILKFHSINRFFVVTPYNLTIYLFAYSVLFFQIKIYIFKVLRNENIYKIYLRNTRLYIIAKIISSVKDLRVMF